MRSAREKRGKWNKNHDKKDRDYDHACNNNDVVAYSQLHRKTTKLPFWVLKAF